MSAQQTVAGRVEYAGQALHLGRDVKMSISPAPPDSGLTFRRIDLPGAPALKAGIETVIDTNRSTSIGADLWRIGTVEHLMAAAHGLGLDNLLVEVDGEELPVGDGSALCFVELLRGAGIAPQDRPRRVYRVQKPVWVSAKDSYLVALPPEGPGLTVNFTFSADRRAIGAQHFQFCLGTDDFVQEIAPARTIAFLEEIEALRRQGLAQSDNMEIAVIVGAEGYLTPLRLPDEIVRHKILDLLGDLYVCGRLHASVLAVRSGHRLNHQLGRALAETSGCLTLIEPDGEGSDT